MNRRKFIQNSSLAAIPLLLNGFGVKAMGGNGLLQSLLSLGGPYEDRVLVIIQLFGGNDGLNTVIPLDVYDKYIAARKGIAIPEKKILSLAGTAAVGLHPSLSGLRDLYNDGKLSIIQSVGYPQPDFSHFRSSDIWMTGSGATEHLSTGWIGRYLGQQHPAYPGGYPNTTTPDPLAVEIGTTVSTLFQGAKSPISVNVADPMNVYNLVNGFTGDAAVGHGGTELNFIRTVAQQAQSYSAVLRKAADNVTMQSDYPAGNPLAQQLKTVARLIKGGLRTRLYMVSFDGFDTHAQQVNTGAAETGRHADLLQTVGDAIKAFQDDLKFLGIEERVAGMTFSEFGRRIVPNDSLGTDHGAAAPLFIFGTQVKGGITGMNPDIPVNATTEDNIPMQVDFRSVYSTLLQDWMQVPENEISQVLFKKYPSLPVLKTAVKDK